MNSDSRQKLIKKLKATDSDIVVNTKQGYEIVIPRLKIYGMINPQGKIVVGNMTKIDSALVTELIDKTQ